MEQVITVATFNELPPAEALKDKLHDAGFHAEILDESGTQSAMFMTTTHKAHLRVRVRKAEIDRANELMRQWESSADNPMRNAVKCPQCSSSRIEYPALSRRTSSSFFVAILNVLRIIPREYYCVNCQYTWPDKPAPQLDLDRLNWPKGSKVP